MITEQQQELACLYTIGALPECEAKDFEQALQTNGELRNFIRSLGNVTSWLALSADVSELPPELKSRIIDSISPQDQLIRPDFGMREDPAFAFVQWMPWAAAACLTLGGIWLFQQNTALTQSEMSLKKLTAAQQQQLASMQVELADWQARDRLSRVQIAVLGSLLENSPKAVAVSAWDADKQDGLLVVQNLAPQPADKDYQLWIMDPQHGGPVDAGVFTVDEKGNVRFRFKPKASVKSADKFAVTLEQKGGVLAPQGTMVLAGGLL